MLLKIARKSDPMTKTREVVVKDNTLENDSMVPLCEANIQVVNKTKVYKRANYPMLDLTLTLYTVPLSTSLLKLLFCIGTAIRLYLTVYFLSVMFITTGLKLSKWCFLIPWVIAVLGSRLLFVILVMRTGLSSPQNHL